MDNGKRTVVVTGFGPFGEHAVNASWVAVKELEQLGLGPGVDLHVHEVPVEYQAVSCLVPSLWEQYHPQLVVHVGVSGAATAITLEMCGHNHGYKRPDNCSFCPDTHCCVEGGADCIKSVIDMETVCQRVKASGLGVSVTVSKDAGRYLCDYTYYLSLHLSGGSSAFVHVPPLGKPYSGEQLGHALRAILLEMLEQLGQDQDANHCEHGH
ncbi:pyroglutamyl-peptidase 1-like [Anguilla rostrata]|uniref:pyroglutamyl-peptidase 1-like n=1 Tax=Anguilla rostrata TaxID=7938 RepID=UPI0030CBECEF